MPNIIRLGTRKLDSFLEKRSLNFYTFLCIFLYLIPVSFFSSKTPDTISFTAFAILIICSSVNLLCLWANPSNANKYAGNIIHAFIYLSLINVFAFLKLGFLFTFTIAVVFAFFFFILGGAAKNNLKQQFPEGINTPYGKCMWEY